MAIIISFLGVGMVAIPTGIISAGFVEQYTEMKVMGEPLEDTGIKYITSRIRPENGWVGKSFNEVDLMPDMVPVMVMRGDEKLVPNGDLIFQENDILVIGVNTLN